MCIRDRYKITPRGRTVNPKMGRAKTARFHFLFTPLARVCSVSYTHLDVYKRQEHGHELFTGIELDDLLGAILAVVVLFWNKLWPFGLRQGKVISKPSVWNLWFKVVAATLPVLRCV